jgi:hypothetical protein
MNQKQRKQWDGFVESCTANIKYGKPEDVLVVDANAYILKLERELQNIKGHKRIAKILLPKESV